MLTALIRPKAERTGLRGFTLIEVLVVILIIGILLAIAIPTFLITQRNSRGGAMDSTGNNITNSMQALATQSNTAANTGQMVLDAIDELSPEDQANIMVQVVGSPPSAVDAASRYSEGALRIYQRIGDSVRAGCIFLPATADQGEPPVYVRHGDADAGGRVGDVTEADCVGDDTADRNTEGTVNGADIEFGGQNISPFVPVGS